MKAPLGCRESPSVALPPAAPQPLCRASPSSLKHAVATCQAWGLLMTAPQRHQHRAPHFTNAIGFDYFGGLRNLLAQNRAFVACVALPGIGVGNPDLPESLLLQPSASTIYIYIYIYIYLPERASHAAALRGCRGSPSVALTSLHPFY